jgi:hypothetical protein
MLKTREINLEEIKKEIIEKFNTYQNLTNYINNENNK